MVLDLIGALPGDAVYDLVLPIETGLGKEFDALGEVQCVVIAWVREMVVRERGRRVRWGLR